MMMPDDDDHLTDNDDPIIMTILTPKYDDPSPLKEDNDDADNVTHYYQYL